MGQPPSRSTMNGKPVLWRANTREVLSLKADAFHHKLLCDGITMSLSDGCAFCWPTRRPGVS